MKTLLRYFLPPAILILAVLAARLLLSFVPEPTVEASGTWRPLVEVHLAKAEARILSYRTHGELKPAHSLNLATRLGGRVLFVAPELRVGNRVEAGQELVRLEETDAKATLSLAMRAVTEAALALAISEADAKAALSGWEMQGLRDATPLAKKEPQLRAARATLAAAQDAVTRAGRDLARCVIVAPFSGIVASRHVEKEQLLAPGAPVAHILNCHLGEIPLAIPAAELHRLGISASGPETALTIEIRGHDGVQRTAWATRIAPQMDPTSRSVWLLAEIADPLGLEGSQPGLSFGAFVSARILGRTEERAFALPRQALLAHNQILVVDSELQLHKRTVQVLQKNDQEFLVKEGLAEGERICLTPVPLFVPGMEVRLGATTP